LFKIILNCSMRPIAASPFGELLPDVVLDTPKTVVARSSDRSSLRCSAMVLLAVAFAMLLCLSAPAQTYVPAVVSSSVSPVPTTVYATPTGTQTNLKSPSEIALDACGNIYAMDHGYDGNAQIIEIPAGGGPGFIADVVNNSYDIHLGQDATHATFSVAAPYSTGVNLIPLAGCVPQSSQSKKVGGGNGALFYYYNALYSAGDFAGNTFITTDQTCCVTGAPGAAPSC
jgi:hypothetical protein